MGNYGGSVRCGHCYNVGHNRRSCPTLTEAFQARFNRQQETLKEAKAKGLTTDTYEVSRAQRQVDHYAGELIQRTGVDPRTGQSVKRVSNRRCSYCKWKHGVTDSEEGKGHTRRTCPGLKEAKEEARLKNVEYRKIVYDGMRNAGLGVGSLIRMGVTGYFPDPDGEERIWETRDCALLVKSINWDEINYRENLQSGMMAQRVDKWGTRDGNASIPLPHVYDEVTGSLMGVTQDGTVAMTPPVATNESRLSVIGSWHAEPDRSETPPRNKDPRLVSTVSAECINPPASWFNGNSDSLDDYFNRLKD